MGDRRQERARVLQEQQRRREAGAVRARPRREHLGETGPLSQGVQAGTKALRTRHINGMEVRKKRSRGFKREAQGVQVSPLNPLCVSPWLSQLVELLEPAGAYVPVEQTPAHSVAAKPSDSENRPAAHSTHGVPASLSSST